MRIKSLFPNDLEYFHTGKREINIALIDKFTICSSFILRLNKPYWSNHWKMVYSQKTKPASKVK